MAGTKRNSSTSTRIAEGVRDPFGPINNLLQVPIALFEIQALAIRGDNDKIVPLIKSVIEVTLSDAHSWHKVADLTPQEVHGANSGISSSIK
jgi:hypothetical protein